MFGSLLVPLARRLTRLALGARGCRPETFAVGPWSVVSYRGGRSDGEPWVLLHGLGATAGTFLPLVDHLRGKARLWLPELSELGGTTGPDPALGISSAVEVLVPLLEREARRGPVTLAGISLGGWIAVRLALARPDLVARLVLLVPAGFRDQDWGRIARYVEIETWRDSEAMFRALFATPPWYFRMLRGPFYLAYRSAAVAAVLATVDPREAYGVEDLARITQPVGLVWGALDDLFRVEVGVAMERALPRARLEVVERAGHAVQWQRPAATLAAIDRIRAAFPVS